MTQAQLIEAALALVVLVAGALGVDRRRRGGSSRRPTGGDRTGGRPRGSRPGSGPRPGSRSGPRPGPRPGGRGSRPAAEPNRRDRRAPSRLPEPREIWWAEVPFEDGPGAKDRPCLVLHRGADTVTVLKITSKHHAERPGVLPLPPGTVGDREHRASWLETDEAREVPLDGFRRRVGTVDAGLWTRVQKSLT
ncbi:type II toxin-antitoxin system PemK/MazF family toxin [Streptacidiphilus cavernicola]|uniref:Type II toxin-antitoxin system PemK/MazF family toxin n=1 Tax=Streptacidiphilus cavernicola TaxID=3342716 RepID=A0ABV6VRL3_9ACTN